MCVYVCVYVCMCVCVSFVRLRFKCSSTSPHQLPPPMPSQFRAVIVLLMVSSVLSITSIFFLTLTFLFLFQVSYLLADIKMYFRV